MAKYAIICLETLGVLEYIRASNPRNAKDIAASLYQGRRVTVCYADEYGCL